MYQRITDAYGSCTQLLYSDLLEFSNDVFHLANEIAISDQQTLQDWVDDALESYDSVTCSNSIARCQWTLISSFGGQESQNYCSHFDGNSIANYGDCTIYRKDEEVSVDFCLNDISTTEIYVCECSTSVNSPQIPDLDIPYCDDPRWDDWVRRDQLRRVCP